jgi:multicomponent Na+:H+ antiporter subunit C
VREVLIHLMARANYWVYIVLMMIGLFAILSKKNYVKKIIGMNIMQTAVILFYISTAAKRGATIPIIEHGPGHGHALVEAARYINPLPHVLMLTAIVVAVATLGVALALMIRIYRQYGTLDEDEVMAKLREP